LLKYKFACLLGDRSKSPGVGILEAFKSIKFDITYNLDIILFITISY